MMNEEVMCKDTKISKCYYTNGNEQKIQASLDIMREGVDRTDKEVTQMQKECMMV